MKKKEMIPLIVEENKSYINGKRMIYIRKRI